MSWVEREIREQPEALARFLDAERDHVAAIVPELLLADVRYLLIASRGSSGNAARYAQYLLGSANQLPVAFSTPSLYTLYDAPPLLDAALAVGISQSGASPDVVSVLAEARRQGRPTLAITNEADSPLARAAEWTLPLHAGEERAVAATKTYLNSLGAIALLSACCRRRPRATSSASTTSWPRRNGFRGRSSVRSPTPRRSTSTETATAVRSWPAASTSGQHSRSP